MKNILIILLLCVSMQSWAQENILLLPRFVSLKNHPVNMRVGPDLDFPIKWVYRKSDLPVKIILEHEHWRKIRDWEGTEGWVHKSLLSSNRTMVVIGTERIIKKASSEKSRTVARVEAGVFGKLLECPAASEFCKIKINEYEGWLKRGSFWGTDKGEDF